MKRLALLPALGVAVLAYACDATGPPTAPDVSDTHIQAKQTAPPPTVFVPASENPSGIPDWENLNAAFAEAIAAGPGSVVQLGAGDFYLHQPVAVEGFDGTFKGAGVDVSTINMAPGVLFGLTYDQLGNEVPVFVAFAGDGGTVKVSDMTLRTEEFTEPWTYYDIPANFMLSTAPVENQNAIFEDLKIVGRQDEAYLWLGYSVRHGIGNWCHGQDGAAKSEFRRIEVLDASVGLLAYQCPESAVIVGGGPHDGIHASTAHTGIVAIQLGSAHISHSHAVAESGITLQYVPDAWVEKNYSNGVHFNASHGTITQNTLEQVPVPWAGVELYNSVVEVSRNEIRGAEQTYVDFTGCNPFGPVFVAFSEAMIVDNDISAETNTTDCAAIFAWSGQNGTIRSNSLAGDFAGDPHFAGVYLGFIDNWNIRDNNVRQLEACPDIHLSAWSSNSTVVGNRHTSVLDEGTGNTLQSVGPYDCAAPVAASTRANLATPLPDFAKKDAMQLLPESLP